MDEATYRAGYRAARATLEPLSEDDLMRRCPQCPAWTIRDVVAHVVHVFGARVDGGWPEPIATDMIAVATHPDRAHRQEAQRRRDDWIEAGVESFRSQPFSAVIAAWERAINRAGDEAWPLIGDLSVHLGDIQEALGIETGRSGTFLGGALARYSWALNEHLRGQALDTVVLLGTEPPFEGGDPSSPHRVSGTSYELLRTITGRRSRAEANRSLTWGTTPEATRAAFPIYDWLQTDSGAL